VPPDAVATVRGVGSPATCNSSESPTRRSDSRASGSSRTTCTTPSSTNWPMSTLRT
jgi:hypothetical protein